MSAQLQAPQRARTDEEKLALRQRILDESVQLYSEVGYESFSMRKLAKKIGYTATTIYSYFKDKDALLSAVVDEAFARFLPVVYSDNPVFRERVREVGLAYIRFGFEEPELYDLMFVHRPVFLIDIAPEVRGKRRQLLAETAAQLTASGRDGVGLTDAFWALLHGLVTLRVTQPDYTYDRAVSAFEAVAALWTGDF